MKKCMLLLLSVILITLAAVHVTTEPDWDLVSQRTTSAPEQENEHAVSWPAVALFSLAGTGTGVVTARALYRKCQN